MGSRAGRADVLEVSLDFRGLLLWVIIPERIDSVEVQVERHRDATPQGREYFQDLFFRFGVHHHGEGSQPPVVPTHLNPVGLTP